MQMQRIVGDRLKQPLRHLLQVKPQNPCQRMHEMRDKLTGMASGGTAHHPGIKKQIPPPASIDPLEAFAASIKHLPRVSFDRT
jgi:hypothetical protein